MTDMNTKERGGPRAGIASARQPRSAVIEPTENEIQRAVFQHIRQRGVAGLVAFHPKNGGVHQRGRRAGINSGLGVVPGVSDIILLYAGQFYALELKRTGGKVKDGDEQDKFLKAVAAQGGISAWAAGLDAALYQLEDWRLLKGNTA